MTDYLKRVVDWRNESEADLCDELPLWSSYFAHILLEKIPYKPDQKVLDIGFGTGFPLIEIAGRLGNSSTVYGIDPWEGAVKRAKHKIEAYGISNVVITTSDASSIPYDDNFFDVITANLVLNNLEEPAKVLSEIHRVLIQSGCLHLTSNLTGHMQEFYDIYADTLNELGLLSHMDALQKNIDHRLNTDIIASMLEQAGLKVAEIINDKFVMSFTDGTALLNHRFIRLGFLDGWKSVVGEDKQEAVFEKLEQNLNKYSKDKGRLKLTVPMVYVRAGKL